MYSLCLIEMRICANKVTVRGVYLIHIDIHKLSEVDSVGFLLRVYLSAKKSVIPHDDVFAVDYYSRSRKIQKRISLRL